MENETKKPLKNYDAMEPVIYYGPVVEVKDLEAQGLSKQEINRKRAEQDV